MGSPGDDQKDLAKIPSHDENNVAKRLVPVYKVTQSSIHYFKSELINHRSFIPKDELRLTD